MSAIESRLARRLKPDDKKERCGFVLNTPRRRIVEVRNVSPTPETSFRMDAKGIVEHSPNAIATWHTHPDGDPNLSEEDFAGFLQWPKLTHYIVGVRNGKVTVCAFRVEDGVVIAV